MGGNSRAVNSDGSLKIYNGKEAFATKLDLTILPRAIVQQHVLDVLASLNEYYKVAYGTYIWDDDVVDAGKIFNGSSKSFFDKTISDPEYILHKRWLGDIDVTVPKQCKSNLWVLLQDLEGVMLSPDMIYVGSNKPTITSIGEQINSVFDFRPANSLLQIDFEFVNFNGLVPTRWATFSKSASWDDQQLGIKGVFHKYLIRALVRNIHVVNNVVMLSPASPTTSQSHLAFLDGLLAASTDPKKIKQLTRELKKATPRHSKPFNNINNINFYTFSILYGIRDKIVLCNDEDNNAAMIDGKRAIKLLPPLNSSYVDDPDLIYEIIFNQRVTPTTRKLFESFSGLCQLITQQAISPLPIIEDFVELLWGDIDKNIRGQALERDDKTIDHTVKLAALDLLCSRTHTSIDTTKLEKWYYENY